MTVIAWLGLDVVGADVVEVSPAYDPARITAPAAAGITFGLLAMSRRVGEFGPHPRGARRGVAARSCVFPAEHEWVGLRDRHPELFEKAVTYEEKVNNKAGAPSPSDGPAPVSRSRGRARGQAKSANPMFIHELRRRPIGTHPIAASRPTQAARTPPWPGTGRQRHGGRCRCSHHTGAGHRGRQ
ncbi:arginase family protein [Streptomyces griseoloalbus]|uniref:Arginase family protein n=1 Tax=Streptomyces griseoloalbus TaxID=67303 RepID=A0ABV3E0T6_9ACTN